MSTGDRNTKTCFVACRFIALVTALKIVVIQSRHSTVAVAACCSCSASLPTRLDMTLRRDCVPDADITASFLLLILSRFASVNGRG